MVITASGVPRRAPIEYGEIRNALHTVRALGAFLLVAASVWGIAAGVDNSWIRLVLATAVSCEAVYRRQSSRGTSPLASLLLDITILGAGLIIRGAFPATEMAALAYALIVALLLLPASQSWLALTYLAGWVVAMALFAPLVASPSDSAATLHVLDRIAMAAVVIAIIAILGSITKALTKVRFNYERALETEREAREIKNEFVSMVSHELRTPLTSIAGFTDTLEHSWRSLDPTEIDEFLAIMRQENERLARLVEDILVIPRLESGRLDLHPEVFDLRAEVYSLFENMFPPGGEKETFLVIPGGVRVLCDRMRFEQVLRNLLDNARKYGGDQILIEGERHGELYEIKVADNGAGVPAQFRNAIFEHFEQLSKGDARDAQGIGLGLPIARKLTRAMGGDLWYEDRFPTGAKFCFTVLLAPATPTPSPEPDPEVDRIHPDTPAVH